MSKLRVATIVLLSASLLSACVFNQNNPDPTPSPSRTHKPSPSPTKTSPKPSPSPSPTKTSPKPSPSPTSTIPAGYSTVPVTVVHNVNAVPTLSGIRPAQHPEDDFDRITFDFDGQIPSYDVRYISNPTDCGSGEDSDVPGNVYLQIVFSPANAHTEEGESTVPRSGNLRFPQLEAFDVTCDFEAVTAVALGLDSKHGFKVRELTNPNRVYIDVAY